MTSISLDFTRTKNTKIPKESVASATITTIKKNNPELGNPIVNKLVAQKISLFTPISSNLNKRIIKLLLNFKKLINLKNKMNKKIVFNEEVLINTHMIISAIIFN